jgi:hypothetical protein
LRRELKDEIRGETLLVPLDRLIERLDFYAIERRQAGIEKDFLAANQVDLILNGIGHKGAFAGHSASWFEITNCDLKPTMIGTILRRDSSHVSSPNA